MSLDRILNQKITVALSERKPFAMLDQNGTPKGLDVLIVENFAQKFHLQIDYVVINSSLNYIFTNEEYLLASSIFDDLKYVIVNEIFQPMY